MKLLDAFNFLNIKITRSICCSNEVTLGGLQDGDWSPETSSHDEKLDVEKPHSAFFREGRGAGDGIIN